MARGGVGRPNCEDPGNIEIKTARTPTDEICLGRYKYIPLGKPMGELGLAWGVGWGVGGYICKLTIQLQGELVLLEPKRQQPFCLSTLPLMLSKCAHAQSKAKR